jgi:hypothetical protein
MPQMVLKIKENLVAGKNKSKKAKAKARRVKDTDKDGY